MAADVQILDPVQLIRKVVLGIALLGAIILVAVVRSPPEWPVAHEAIEAVGLALILICIVGRSWCTLYIGGRKGAELVDVGPYSLCRNPLYFFSFLGAAGAGAQTGSLTVALLFTVAAWVVFRITVSREEGFLKGALGQPYADYLATTPRFLPLPWLWKGKDMLEVQPRRVALTFFDGLTFLLAIPLAEGLEMLQNHGLAPVLLRLP